MIEDLVTARSDAERFVRAARADIAHCLEQELSVECIVSGRVKSETAIKEKLTRRRHKQIDAEQEINDYIGLRVVTATLGALVTALPVVDRWARNTGLREVRRRNSLFSPPPGGYRMIHIDYRIEDPASFNLPATALVEIQLTSYLFHLHAVVNRHYFYKRATEVKSRIEPLFDQLSALLYELEPPTAEMEAELMPENSFETGTN